jgi:acetylornithine deacetylase/succinyl-diaminopimelate desuccinylase-like protein
MKDPFSGKIAVPVNDGVMEPCAYGQGASQNKSHFTSMLTLLKALIDSKTEIDGTLYFAANNEGRSSHECTWSLLPHLDPKPDYAIILIGGSNRISVANRGRVDILIDIKGKATHSSDPSSGLNAVDGAVEVLGRIKQMKFTKTHPKLGGQHAVPYQLTFEPIAPHTLPAYAHIKIDRRLLPGDEIDEAVEEIRTAIGNMTPYLVSVKKDVYMLPSEVDPNSEVVKSLQNAIRSIDGKEASLVYGKGAYDAGGPTSKGIPTIMYGRPITGKSLLGDDYVSLRGVEEEARIIGKTLLDIMN